MGGFLVTPLSPRRARAILVRRGLRLKPRPLLVLTVGLPGCGKTTRALAWVAEDPHHRARVGRDPLRRMLHGQPHWEQRWQEDQVTAVQHAAVAELLLSGIHVVVDDTNLSPRRRGELIKLARRVGACVEVWDMRHVPLEVCVARDAKRTGDFRIGADVIRRMRDQATADEPAAWPNVGK